MKHFVVLQDMDDHALAALENSAPLSDLVAALRAPGRPAELSGQAAAVAAFSAQKEKAQHREKTVAMEKLSNVRWLPTRVGTKLGAATAVTMLAFTGVAAAAVTGSLPAPIQSFVHAHLGAVTSGGPSVKTGTAPKSHAGSAPHAGPTSPSSGATAPAGPAGAGASTAGQCEAFTQHVSWHGRLPQPPAATSLQKAAAAAGKTVPEFCAPYLVHGKPSTPTKSHGGPGSNDSSGSNGGRSNGGRGNGGSNGPHGSGSTSSSTTTGHGHGHGHGHSTESGVSSRSGSGEH
jgi:hypothetical protein